MNDGPQKSPESALKIIHIDDGKEWRGGQHQVWLLMNGLRDLGVTQWLATVEDSPLGEKAKAAGFDILPMAFKGEWNRKAAKSLAHAALKCNCDILHAHTGHAHAIGLQAVKRCKKKVKLLTTRRVDFAVGRNVFSRRKYANPNQHYIAISHAIHDVLIAGGVDPSRIDVVHSGVPPLTENALTREQSRELFDLPDDQIALVNVGAMTDHKDQITLIRSMPPVFEAYPTAHLHIFGDGELNEVLPAIAKGLSICHKVTFHGWVPEIREKLAGFDCFITSSHMEGLGTANLDACIHGIPLVATAGGGIPEIVKDGETGLLAPIKQPTKLAEAIIHVLKDENLRKTLVQNARQHVEQNFSAQAMAEGNLKVYQKLKSKSR